MPWRHIIHIALGPYSIEKSLALVEKSSEFYIELDFLHLENLRNMLRYSTDSNWNLWCFVRPKLKQKISD